MAKKILFHLALITLALSASTTYNLIEYSESDTGFRGIIAADCSSCSYETLKVLSLDISYPSANSLRVTITDAHTYRWDVSQYLGLKAAENSGSNFSVELNSQPFGVSVKRKSDGKQVFAICPEDVFQYNARDIIVNTSFDRDVSFYGLGERATDFKLNNGVYTMFSRDAAGPYDDGKPPGKNMYSIQPFYLAVDQQGSSSGVLFLNSNAMDATVSDRKVQFRTIGGIVDIFVFEGPSPLEVVEQYLDIVGSPREVPYWALGWHHCRWGYTSLQALQNVVQKYEENNLPLDTIWSDIDYMLNYRNFVLDSSRYPYAEFKNWTDYLHSTQRQIVPIVDAGIAAQNYFGYNEGLARGVFIQSPHHRGPLIGQVWPGNATYVDWFHPNATQYWGDMLDIFRETFEFDGLWNDMNEASNFVVGEVGYGEVKLDLPYTPGQTDINTKTLDVTAKHYGGLTEYDVHSLYGMLMAQASAEYIEEKLKRRPMVISRSSFVTHGKRAQKWLGDNFSTFEWLQYSITGVFNFQMFGVPLIGADICGFNGNTTEELCARWFQTGTLYPFARQHNSIDSTPQEPWVFSDQLLKTADQAIRTRYQLMPFIYTQMQETSKKNSVFFRPAFFNYPSDESLHSKHSQDNFMLGPSLLIHPVLTSGATQLDAYFPDDIWYNWYTGDKVTDSSQTLQLDAPLYGKVNIHISGGSIVPTFTNYNTVTNVHQLRKQPISLVVALDGNGEASGNLIIDDGESLDSSRYAEVEFQVKYYGLGDSRNNLKVAPVVTNYERVDGEYPEVVQVVVYGCKNGLVFIMREDSPCIYEVKFDPLEGKEITVELVQQLS